MNERYRRRSPSKIYSEVSGKVFLTTIVCRGTCASAGVSAVDGSCLGVVGTLHTSTSSSSMSGWLTIRSSKRCSRPKRIFTLSWSVTSLLLRWLDWLAPLTHRLAWFSSCFDFECSYLIDFLSIVRTETVKGGAGEPFAVGQWARARREMQLKSTKLRGCGPLWLEKMSHG